MERLKEKYIKEVAPALIKELELGNVMEVPKITKVVVSAGIGDFRENKDAVAGFEEELAFLTGQKPSERKARMAEAGFKIRKGDKIGYTTTLRGKKMWAFLDKFINIVLPRVRDFNGLNPKSFDGGGNFSIGLDEHTIFPEVDANMTKGIRGLQVTIVTNTRDDEKSKALLSSIGVPFEKEKERHG